MPLCSPSAALGNVVAAYDKAGLLDRELLEAVFTVAALRLDRRDAPPAFKPQASTAQMDPG